jgi:hypothetical protein
MDAAIHHLIEAIHQAPAKCVLAIAGGGTGAAALLLEVPGGSRTVLEIQVPYHEQALTEYLGRRPEQFCSTATSRDLAGRAYERARWLTPLETVVGLGCTASLATDRPKRGEHRFYLAIRTADRLATFSLVLSKGARSREEEEDLLDRVLLNGLAEAFGTGERVPVPLLPSEQIQTETVSLVDPFMSFMLGQVPAVVATVDGQFTMQAPRPILMLSGAFNPVHEGHWGMAAAARRLTGHPVAFELSVTNVDKPPLPPAEIRRRLQQFTWRVPVWLTRAPTFAEKAALFPGAVFIVGADTAARIVAPRYYEHSEEQMVQALNCLGSQGCRFLVAGRVDAAGKFLGLGDLDIPAGCRDLFTDIPETVFRLDLSSTQIRTRQAAPASGD